MAKLRVVVAHPGALPMVTEIDEGLEPMQAVVGGYIDVVRVDDLDVWVNDEGVIMGLPFNRVVAGIPLCGPLLIASSNEEGDTLGLSDDQVLRAMALLGRNVPRTTTVQA